MSHIAHRQKKRFLYYVTVTCIIDSPLMGRSLLTRAWRFSGTFTLPVHYRFSSLPLRLCSPSSTPVSAMASAANLSASIEGLSLQSTTQTSKFPNCFPSLNPMDQIREHIAEKLGKATGIDAEKIYTRLAWTNTLDKGDLSLPVCDSTQWCFLFCVGAN